MNKVELHEIVGGALQEKFNKAFENVIENLQDANTSYKVKRKITISLDFTQNESRDDVHVDVAVVEKLAPQAPMTTSFAIGKDLQSGKVYAEEYGKAVRGQLSFDDLQENTTDDAPAETTGNDTVVNFRTAANS